MRGEGKARFLEGFICIKLDGKLKSYILIYKVYRIFIMEKIKCRICGKECGRKGFHFHLTRLHNMTHYEYVCKYLEDFPNWGKCEICGKVTQYERGKNNKGGLTCSHKCNGIRNGRLTKESGRMNGDNNITKRPEVRKKISEKRKAQGNFQIGLKRSKKTKQLQSERAIERTKRDDYVNPMFGKTHSVETIKKIFKYRKMTTPEKQIADFLEENNIKYHFQFFITENDICKSYDFKIKGKPIIIEVDGDYWHGGPGVKKSHSRVNETKENDKLKEQIAKDRGYRIYRFWESELKNDKEKIFNKILVLI